ncbi:MAG: ABC transporter ATP-binding protein [Bifidobacteriaceae bacterium]|jgi:putative ABC transport system ATP-binding protein|nr:ABC transporter ATP-binding protein [Bifidobacteriaceae bacterium]
MESAATKDLFTKSYGKEIINLENITREFTAGKNIKAVDNVNLKVYQGDYISITGTSGSGKSTLLNIIGLLDVPTFGKYEIDGVNVSTLTDDERSYCRSCKIGFVFQDFHLISTRTALENVAMGLLYRGLGADERIKKAKLVIRKVGLDERSNALPQTMSGGEKQRIAIARALVNEPSILLCDEPTGSLDSQTTDEILSLLEDLNGAGSTIINVTHDLQASSRAKKQIKIQDGRIL